MADKIPIVQKTGQLEQIQSGDAIDENALNYRPSYNYELILRCLLEINKHSQSDGIYITDPVLQNELQKAINKF